MNDKHEKAESGSEAHIQSNDRLCASIKKPVHSDIEKYDLFLLYSPSLECWFAAYDGDKGAAWYRWDGTDFKMLMHPSELPRDLKEVT